MQCACAILFVACPALQYFSTLFHKRHDFLELVADYKMCVLIFWNMLLIIKCFDFLEHFTDYNMCVLIF
jgi:hypothetical protein